MNNNALTQPARSREKVALDHAVKVLKLIAGEGDIGSLPPHAQWRSRAARSALNRIKTLREAGE